MMEENTIKTGQDQENMEQRKEGMPHRKCEAEGQEPQTEPIIELFDVENEPDEWAPGNETTMEAVSESTAGAEPPIDLDADPAVFFEAEAVEYETEDLTEKEADLTEPQFDVEMAEDSTSTNGEKQADGKSGIKKRGSKEKKAKGKRDLRKKRKDGGLKANSRKAKKEAAVRRMKRDEAARAKMDERYDGYYDDVPVIDSNVRFEGLSVETKRKVAMVVIGALVVIGICLLYIALT